MIVNRYVLVHKDGVDTLHCNPVEQCNLDDSRRDEDVDEFTAEAMLNQGHAKRCEHCWQPGA